MHLPFIFKQPVNGNNRKKIYQFNLKKRLESAMGPFACCKQVEGRIISRKLIG